MTFKLYNFTFKSYKSLIYNIVEMISGNRVGSGLRTKTSLFVNMLFGRALGVEYKKLTL